MPDYILYTVFTLAAVIIIGAIVALTWEMFDN
jgi:hypothetical protein